MKRPDCTCCGPAPGYPMHEWWCGLPEIEDGCRCGSIFVVADCPLHGHLADVPDESEAA